MNAPLHWKLCFFDIQRNLKLLLTTKSMNLSAFILHILKAFYLRVNKSSCLLF